MATLAVALLFGCGSSSGEGASEYPTAPPVTEPSSPSPFETPEAERESEVPELPPDFDSPTPPTPTAPTATEEETVEGQVPTELIGEWDGDGTLSSPVNKITFFADGTVSLLYRDGTTLEGPAVVESSRITLHVPGRPIVHESWYIEELDAGYGYVYEILMLDGVSYVRQLG